MADGSMIFDVGIRVLVLTALPCMAYVIGRWFDYLLAVQAMAQPVTDDDTSDERAYD